MPTKKTMGYIGLVLAIVWVIVMVMAVHFENVPWRVAFHLICGTVLVLFGLKMFANRNDKA